MGQGATHDSWSAGDSYDAYMGRWSRQVAMRFLDWLDMPRGRDWLDLGCGTGALSAAVLARAVPASVLGVDPSAGFVDHASATIDDQRARFAVGDAASLPVDGRSVDVAVSGLVLNFIPDRPGALAALARAVRPGSTVAGYVWDYPGQGMGMISAFWREAAKLDTRAGDLDEARRFPHATRATLLQDFADAGLDGAESAAIEIETVFDDFDAYWRPFTLGTGPAPGYLASLPGPQAEQLRDAVKAALGDGPITMTARAWAVRAPVAG
ncbi:methyltransferase domain-containing protein [Rhodobacteraceae bacterium 2CG4]|uniref:Methyltransferase domain-containing protein n=1 Tax=Halovulum marinum TaxID=2662447 RepID=A0A6L5YWG1_9RHOB|nr:class I SAM-dependent methyltransferase [Halovulum marinum]MSU88713.1 methyltransferase domain-containing protein [Halovulum marinum]